MEGNLIALPSFYYNKENIPVTKNKVKVLIQEGYLTVNRINNVAYFNRDEIMKIVQIEKDLSENYLSTDSFLQTVCRSSSPEAYREHLCEIHSMCNQVNKINTVNYRNSLYFNKFDVEKFIDNVYLKDELLHKLNINIYIYESIVHTDKINIIRISRNTEYIPKSDVTKVKVLSKDFSSRERKAKWIKGTTIINSSIFSKLVKKNETLYRLCLENSIKHFRNREKVLYVEYYSLSSFYRKHLNLSKNYYTFTDIRKLFGMNKTSISILKANFVPNLFAVCEKLNIKYFKTGQQLLGDSIYFRKKHITEFLTHYIANKEVINQYNINYRQLNFLITFNNIEQFELHKRLKFYERKEIIEMFNKDYTWLYLGKKKKFYTLKETLKLLNVSESELVTIRKETQLSFYDFHNTTYYKKKEINDLLRLKQDITEEYVPSSLVSEKLGEHYFRYFKNRKKPKGIERYSFNKSSPTSLLFPKSEYEYLLQQKEHQKQLDSVSYHDPLSAFYELLKINDIKFHEKSPITQQYWFDYCTDSILYNNKAEEIMPYFVNALVRCTSLLVDFILDSELHLKSSNEINLGLLNSNIAINHRNILIPFINKLYYGLVKDNIKSSFKITKVKKTLRSKKSINQDKGIYDYSTFKEVYSYVGSKSRFRTQKD